MQGLRVEGEMVKVGSMSRARRILLVVSVLLLGWGNAEAGLWGKKAQKSPEPPTTESAMTLTAVEIDGSRLFLRTTGAPAYTSYSPSPGVFVLDLTGTSRDASLAIPTALPAAVASITAEEVVEMGSALTRVTLRLTGAMQPTVAASDRAVEIILPAATPSADQAVASIDVVPAAPLQAAAAAPVEETPAPTIEPIAEPAVETSEPVAHAEEIPLPRARSLRSIDTAQGTAGLEVRLTGDGQLEYKAFRLENPSRLVIDLTGVRNAVKRSNVNVDGDIVERVRVAQFQSVPPVARVVVDLNQKSSYDIRSEGEDLRISFGSAASVASAEPRPSTIEYEPVKLTEKPAAAPVTTPAPARKVPIIPADAPAVPVIAENAPAWQMPAQESRGAKQIVNAPQTQAPATRPATQEDVFDERQVATAAAQSLSGARTLSGSARVFNGEPISLNLKDADIKDVLKTFSELTGLNIAVDPGVSGSVTVDFVDVPWDQALDLILRQNGLTFTLEGNVMRIGTMERIANETAAQLRLQEQERLNVPLTTLGVKLSYARATEISALLREIASPRARIIVDARTNQLIISEIPQFLQTMQNLISTVDIPTRQVMIEARIVESSRSFTQQWGFEWGFEGEVNPANGTNTGMVFPNRIGYTGGPFNFGAGGNNILSLAFSDVLGLFNLDLALLAAESQGYAKIISAPRVTTQDNTSAEIQSGFQIPYQTRINFTTTVTYLDATLRLTVTPQITAAGTVIMDIAVQKNEPVSGLAIEGAAGTPLTTRRAQTRLMVRDGGTAVIAGIFQTRDNSSQTRVPFVHTLPVIGNLFKSHRVETSHDELLIFITPRIVRG